jgi:hypothetical protein
MAAMNHHRPDGFVLARRESRKDSRLTILETSDVDNIHWAQIAELLGRDIPRVGNALSISASIGKAWSGCLDMTSYRCRALWLFFRSEDAHRKAGDVDRIAFHGC